MCITNIHVKNLQCKHTTNIYNIKHSICFAPELLLLVSFLIAVICNCCQCLSSQSFRVAKQNITDLDFLRLLGKLRKSKHKMPTMSQQIFLIPSQRATFALLLVITIFFFLFNLHFFSFECDVQQAMCAHSVHMALISIAGIKKKVLYLLTLTH